MEKDLQDQFKFTHSICPECYEMAMASRTSSGFDLSRGTGGTG